MKTLAAAAWLCGMLALASGCGRSERAPAARGAGAPRDLSVNAIAPRDAAMAADLPPVQVSNNDWPWWRGPQRNNHASGPLPPVTWSQKQNVLWKTEVPGRGHASPCIWGDAIFIATADESEETQSLECYDRDTGRRRWSREVHRGGFLNAHSKNSQASATPACDGERVFVAFLSQDALWVTGVDVEGKIVWQTKAGPFSSQHGYGSSPVIYESLVIVSGDHQGEGYVTALHRKTGDIVWRVVRGREPSYGTPVVASTGGREQLLLSGQSLVESYDPATGKQLWSSPGPAQITANTLAWNADLVFAGGGYPENSVMAIRADGSKVAWQTDFKAYVPSPLAVGDRLFVIQDNGVARCLNAMTGDEVWTKRLGGDFTASPVLAGDTIFVPNEAGVTYVFKAADRYQEIARNDLEEDCYASPVICGGRLYQRTSGHLYCIAQ
jgi:outer membrane protein assembly factor BamB